MGNSPRDLCVAPRSLTPKEAKWVAELQSVLLAMPKTLELGAVGRSTMWVLDGARDAAVRATLQGLHVREDSLSGGRAQQYGIELAVVQSAGKIHGYNR